MNIENREILSRQFIEDVKNLAAEKFGVNKIKLVGSYRRNEATEESDVDFLILDEKSSLWTRISKDAYVFRGSSR